jgi:gliding motility associated protien GldN
MKKLNLTLVFSLALLFFYGQSYGQVIQNETKDTAKSSVMEPIRPPVNGSYEKTEHLSNKPMGLPWVREADFYWSETHWSVIDLRQKFNFPLYYPTEPKGSWKSFMQAILDAIDSNESNPNPLRVYTDEYVNIPVSPTELKSAMGETRIQIKYNEDTYEEEGQIEYFVPWGSKEVYRYVIKEDWRIDKQRSVMDNRIVAICPMFWYEKADGGGDDGGGGGSYSEDEEVSSGGEEEDEMPAMPTRRWREFGWIWYPEVRPMMAVTPIYNTGNAAQMRNYDDLFLQHRFASFIKAQQNVHDNREINMYILNGMDQTLEAEKIKEKVRVKEHDMWEF